MELYPTEIVEFLLLAPLVAERVAFEVKLPRAVIVAAEPCAGGVEVEWRALGGTISAAPGRAQPSAAYSATLG